MNKKDLTKKEVVHLAELVQLKLTDIEVEKYQKQLSETLEYVSNLSELHPKEQNKETQINIFFTDKISDQRILSSEKALANAQKKKDRFFIVDRVL